MHEDRIHVVAEAFPAKSGVHQTESRTTARSKLRFLYLKKRIISLILVLPQMFLRLIFGGQSTAGESFLSKRGFPTSPDFLEMFSFQ